VRRCQKRSRFVSTSVAWQIQIMFVFLTQRANKAVQATPIGAFSSAVADGAFWFGVPDLGR